MRSPCGGPKPHLAHGLAMKQRYVRCGILGVEDEAVVFDKTLDSARPVVCRSHVLFRFPPVTRWGGVGVGVGFRIGIRTGDYAPGSKFRS